MGRIILSLLAVVFTINLIRSVFETRRNLGRLNSLREEVSRLKEDVGKLRGELEYKKSPEFLEREARDKLGLIKEGEKLVILPDDSSIAPPELVQRSKEGKTPNWVKWKKFLFE